MDTDKLEARRADLGLSYAELARRSGRNLHTVRRMLKRQPSDRRGPLLRTFNAVSAALDTIERERACGKAPIPLENAS